MESTNTKNWVRLKRVHFSLFASFTDDRACSIFRTYREVDDVNEIMSRAQAMEGDAAKGEAAKGDATATMPRYDGVAGGGLCGSKSQEQGEGIALDRFGSARVAPQEEQMFVEQEDDEAGASVTASAGAEVGGADVPADDEAAHLAVMEKAFSGPAVKKGLAKTQAAAPAITNEEVVAGGVAALEGEHKAAAEAESARIQTGANVARVLRADGVTPTEVAVSLFLDGKEGRGETKKKQGKAATDWLIVAEELAPYNKVVADLVHRLLGTHQYTTNLGFMGQWARLCEESQALADRVGSQVLQPLYLRHDLGEVMGDAALRNRIVYRPSPQGGAGGGGGGGPKPSQRSALPALFDEMKSEYDFNNYGAMPKHCCLVIFLLLASVIQPLFEDAINTLFGGESASWCNTSVAPVKGFARALVKIYNDYSKLAEPRAQWILDALRCLLSVPNHLGMYYVVEAIGKRFGGFVQLKNPFSLPEEDRAKRGHLLLANGTVIFDAGKTIGDLVNGAAADGIFAELLSSTNHGQPQGRWTKMVEDGIAFIRRPELANQPAKMAVEIQFTFTAIVNGRTLMHYPYDVVRAGNEVALYTNFKLAGAAGGSGKEEAATTLYSACFYGQLDRVVQFLEGGTDVNEDDGDGLTGVSAAVQNNHPDVVATMIEAGADVNKAKTTDGTTPLIMAAQNGHGDVVAQLVQAGADVDNATTDDGWTPLYMAAQLGHGAAVAQLVQAGADVDKATTTTGATPLFMAAQKGLGDVVAQLVQAGADVNKAKTDNGATPLFAAAMDGHGDVVAQLVQAGAGVDKATTTGQTPLYTAASKGHVNVVKHLLAAGADKSVAEASGWTPLKIAGARGHAAVVALLE